MEAMRLLRLIGNAQKPTVTQGNLLIEVYAAGVNPVDWKIREGYMRQMMPLKFPPTLGGDFSGIVAEVGRGVSGFKLVPLKEALKTFLPQTGKNHEWDRTSGQRSEWIP